MTVVIHWHLIFGSLKLSYFSFSSDPESSYYKIITYTLAHELRAVGSSRFDLPGTGSFCSLERPCFLCIKYTCISFHAIHYVYKNSKAFTFYLFIYFYFFYCNTFWCLCFKYLLKQHCIYLKTLLPLVCKWTAGLLEVWLLSSRILTWQAGCLQYTMELMKACSWSAVTLWCKCAY